MSAPCHPALALVAAAVLLAGCGAGEPERASSPSPTPTAEPAQTITIEEIERLNRERRESEAPEATPSPEAAAAPAAGPPPITKAFIPFPQQRKDEMAAYARRHYGIDSYRLTDPRVIVQHYTVTETAADAIAIFEPDEPDAELGELPGTCAHFVIDRDGTTYQLVPLSIMCRHTVGLNYTAIGIEHAGFTAEEVLSNDAQLEASLELTRWLQCRFGIAGGDVIGHNESLSSPHHREQVPELRTQTHDDFTAGEMAGYRERLSRGSGPAGC